MSDNHRDPDDIAAAEAEGERAATRAADDLLGLEFELAASGVPRREANKRIKARRKTLRQEFKRSAACSYWYDEHNFDADCWNTWNSAGTEQRVRQLESLLASNGAFS